MIFPILLFTLVLLIVGVTLAYAFGLGTIMGFESLDQPLTAIPNVIFGGMDSFAIMAIPFYLLAGSIMQQAGLSERLLDLVARVTGSIRGSLGTTLVLTSALFGAITGSSVATVSAMGKVVAPKMKRSGYDHGYIGALTSVTGTLGIFIPPSIPMVVFGLSTGTSIGDLFMGGLSVGLVLAAMMVLINTVWAGRMPGLRDSGARFDRQSVHFARQFGTTIPVLVLPVVVVGGIYGGIFTPTEAGAVVCGLAAVVAMSMYGRLKAGQMTRAFLDAAVTSSSLLIILAVGTGFSRYLTLSGISRDVADWVSQNAGGTLGFLLLVNVAVTGMALFIEENTTIVIMAPLLFPISTSLGIDPVHFGVIMVTIIAISLWTPPVAPNLFVATQACGVSLAQMIKPVLVFMAISGLPLLLVVNAFPDLVLLFVR